MVKQCPICSNDQKTAVYDAALPVLDLVPKQVAITDALFAHLDIVCCTQCGHLYNQGFTDQLVDQMYLDVPMPSFPVDPSMEARFHDLLSWMGSDYYTGKRVVEIGSGSGHLARLLAMAAERVRIYEPCNSLTPAMFPEDNVELISSVFPNTSAVAQSVDLVVCRQVIEHVADPYHFMSEVRKYLKPDGFAYLEVPSTEYIEELAPVWDLHLQHVQYFTGQRFVALAKKVGLAPIEKLDIKDGHDFGILFGVTAPDQGVAVAALASGCTLQKEIQVRLEETQQNLAQIKGNIALYGATTHGQIFFNTAGKACQNITQVFDDNDLLDGYCLYNEHRKLDAALPVASHVSQYENIIVAAYLHDLRIAEKLREKGYQGNIYTINPRRISNAEYDLMVL